MGTNGIDKSIQWIEVGYELFAQFGPERLKIDKISAIIGKSRSSFYHHFVDLDLYLEQLLEYHIQQSKIMARKERNCQTLNPDLIRVLLEFKTDVFFSKQLRANRHISQFEHCFNQVNQEVEGAFMEVWTREMGLEQQKMIADGLLNMTFDHFYMQISWKDYSFEWLAAYIDQIKKFACSIAADQKSSS